MERTSVKGRTHSPFFEVRVETEEKSDEDT